MTKKFRKTVFGGVAITLLILSCALAPRYVSADAVLQQTLSSANSGASSVSVTGGAASAGTLLVAVCGSRENTTIAGPSGFSVAIRETGTPSQGIFYKIATGGETSFTCSGGTGNNRIGIHIYEYSGIQTAEPLDAVNTAASAGSSNAPASGSVVTSTDNVLLISGVTINAGNSSLSESWNNSFTSQNSFNNGGAAGSRSSYGGATRTVSAAGTYSTVTSSQNSGSWRGQIAAFKILQPVLSADIVDASGNPVASPSIGLAPLDTEFGCQASSGTLGSSSQKIRVTNSTANGNWSLSMAATDGPSALWNNGTSTYDFNDPAGAPAGCNNGQLTLDPAAGTVVPQVLCSGSGVSKGSSAAFSQAVIDAIVLLNASGSQTDCYYDLTGVSMLQQVPGETPASATPYTINMTLTVTAN